MLDEAGFQRAKRNVLSSQWTLLERAVVDKRIPKSGFRKSVPGFLNEA